LTAAFELVDEDYLPRIPAPQRLPTFRSASAIVRTRCLEFNEELTMLVSGFTATEGVIVVSVDVAYELRRRRNLVTRGMQTFCEYTVRPIFRLSGGL
jgi:hypothetical protein